MSIKLLAKELYQAQQKVAELDKSLAEASLDKRTDIESALRNARSQLHYLQRALDGKIGR